jgi:AcrR family transcriptional regulator/DNA-binding MarR family transcriptional regulator
MAGTERAPSERAGLGRSTPGPNGLGRERVADIQRARMLTAMVELASEHAAADVTVAHIVARSGVSRRTFYEFFPDRKACFLAACDEAIARASRYVLEGYDRDAKWRDRIRIALTGLLSFLDDEPGMGRLLIVESLGAGGEVLERRGRVLGELVAAVDEGRREGGPGREPSRLVAEGIVGGVLSILHSRLAAGEDRALVELTGPLMSMIVLPYLGSAATQRELRRPIPRRSQTPRTVPSDPLRDLKMRLTYRTVCVLMTVAEHPGSSNRQVGEASGIHDQGQISKLLSRLHRLNLIQNTGTGPAKGAPNAWTLTPKGQDIQAAIKQAANN